MNSDIKNCAIDLEPVGGGGFFVSRTAAPKVIQLEVSFAAVSVCICLADL